MWDEISLDLIFAPPNRFSLVSANREENWNPLGHFVCNVLTKISPDDRQLCATNDWQLQSVPVRSDVHARSPRFLLIARYTCILLKDHITVSCSNIAHNMTDEEEMMITAWIPDLFGPVLQKHRFTLREVRSVSPFVLVFRSNLNFNLTSRRISF